MFPGLLVAAVEGHHVALVVDIPIIDGAVRDKGGYMLSCGGVGMPALAFAVTHDGRGGGWWNFSLFVRV